MKFKALFAALLLTSLAGCANQAVVTLQDGSEVLVRISRITTNTMTTTSSNS